LIKPDDCHRTDAALVSDRETVTLFASFKSFTFRLWDEQRESSSIQPSPTIRGSIAGGRAV